MAQVILSTKPADVVKIGSKCYYFTGMTPLPVTHTSIDGSFPTCTACLDASSSSSSKSSSSRSSSSSSLKSSSSSSKSSSSAGPLPGYYIFYWTQWSNSSCSSGCTIVSWSIQSSYPCPKMSGLTDQCQCYADGPFNYYKYIPVGPYSTYQEAQDKICIDLPSGCASC